jgi:hypothetical protein
MTFFQVTKQKVFFLERCPTHPARARLFVVHEFGSDVGDEKNPVSDLQMLVQTFDLPLSDLLTRRQRALE